MQEVRTLKRSVVLAVLVLGVVAMLATWFLMGPWGRDLLSSQKRLPPEVIAALPDISLGTDEIKHENLDMKYLTSEELKQLKITMDLDQVPYLTSLQLDRWAPVLPMDNIAAITRPIFTTAKEAEMWLKEDDLVLGVVYQGILRAYPLRILDRHEIVNDRIGDTPLAVTYSPLCYTGIVYQRPDIASQTLEFGVSGRLYNANLLMYDRQTGSLWDQFLGRVIVGPLLGKTSPLERIPANIASWGVWKQAYPATQVLARPSSVQTPRGTRYLAPSRYEQYVYDEYRLKPDVGYGVDIHDLDLRGMNSKRKIVGLMVDERAKAYEEFVVKEAKIINDDVGGEPIMLVNAPDDRVRAFRRTLGSQVLQFDLQGGQLMDQETHTPWSYDGVPLSGPIRASGRRLEELVVTPAFWFAWVAFYPETELYSRTH